MTAWILISRAENFSTVVEICLYRRYRRGMATAQRPGSVDQELVLGLGCLAAQLLPVVGGKAANLGELIRAGFPVPPGFCITTAAYQQVAADAVDSGTEDTGLLAERARTAILAAPVPADVTDAVESAYRALGDDVPVAAARESCG
jgi:phosphoenolpyruvate synthase/pyruvate phosphate dikinase